MKVATPKITPAPLTPKEQKVLNFISQYIEKHGYAPTYIEIQQKLKYRAVSSVQQFVNQLAAKGHLQTSAGENKKRALALSAEVSGAGESDVTANIPLEGFVAAGRLTEAVRNAESIEVPRSLLRSGGEYFALRVKGDSMIGECIMDGDLVIIKRQSTAQNRQTVVALVDDEATIKKYHRRGDLIELHPANPQFEVIKVQPGAEFRILGVLASVIRRLE
jgi:repressor LexA